jgi:hypothetical protein
VCANAAASGDRLASPGVASSCTQAVEPLSVDAVPPGAKGVAAVAGWLSVQLSGEVLRAVLAKVADCFQRRLRTWQQG